MHFSVDVERPNRAPYLFRPPPRSSQSGSAAAKRLLYRVINALRACLVRAHAKGKVPSKDALEEAIRLQNAAAPDLWRLVRAALLTGCRAGELPALRTADFDIHSQTLLTAESKSGNPRRVPLTIEGMKLFEDITAGVAPGERVFTRTDGSPWLGEPEHECALCGSSIPIARRRRLSGN